LVIGHGGTLCRVKGKVKVKVRDKVNSAYLKDLYGVHRPALLVRPQGAQAGASYLALGPGAGRRAILIAHVRFPEML